MVLSRAPRRKVVTVLSDDEDSATGKPVGEDSDDEPIRPQRRGTSRSKPVIKAKKAQQPAPTTSTQEGSSQKSPAKPKATKTKSKTATKDVFPSNGKPIYSFFNAATQRQTLSQRSASPEKQPKVELEAILDDSDDEGTSVAVSKGSSTALALRKRKAQTTSGFQDESSLAPSATQKFRKTSDSSRAPSVTTSITVRNEDKRPWIEQFAPADLTELAVHKRKVADVRQWLDSAINGRRHKVLVLKGAAGTGKTATVRLLAQDLGAEISEWRNPAGADTNGDDSTSAVSYFEDFVRRAGKAASLTFTSDGATDIKHEISLKKTDEQVGTDGSRQILLIEEFPNTFSRTSAALQSFRSTIMQYVSSPAVLDGTVTPIVMVISETLLSTNTAAADSFTAHRLLGPELVNHPLINTIEFNAVAPTFLTKALETIVVKEARKSGRRTTPGPQVLKRLAETGDIRSAISSLEFLCLRGDDTGAWSSKVHFTKPKKKPPEVAVTKVEEEALKLVSNRESSLGIFHAVGRVVYNNRVDPPPDNTLAQPAHWLPQHRRAKVPERDVNALIDELGTETSTFIAALHENYALSCNSSSTEELLDSLSGSADSISDADLLSVDRFSFGTRAFSGSAVDGLRQDEMAFQVAVRGLLFNLPSPVHRSTPGGNKADAHRMFYPTSLKLWKTREEIEGMLELLTARARSGEVDSNQPSRLSHTDRGDGVKSWSSKANFGEASAQQSESATTDLPLLTITKAEMLLERLPYQAQLLVAREHGSEPSALLKRVSLIANVSDRTRPTVEDEAEENEDDVTAPAESWTTDEPETEIGLKNEMTKHSISGKGKQRMSKTEGVLAIPVEAHVERLVLEDDDIVDD